MLVLTTDREKDGVYYLPNMGPIVSPQELVAMHASSVVEQVTLIDMYNQYASQFSSNP